MKQSKPHFGQSAFKPGVFLPQKALTILTLALAFYNAAYGAKPVSARGKTTPTCAPGSAKKRAPVHPNSVTHGKKLFERLTCAGCHPDGLNTLHPYRPIKGPGFLVRFKEDGKIERLIRTGVPRAGMPSFSKAQLGEEDMKDLIAYIRSLTPISKK
ncbi:MAG: cytochrome c [Candidatus Melainabacteria bacterium]|nr:cytochrome c [Candidatus Melainabacteria bacterium]